MTPRPDSEAGVFSAESRGRVEKLVHTVVAAVSSRDE